MDAARQLSKTFEPYHAIAYYCPEVAAFTDAGFRGWWHAYFAYRSAPLGVVPAPVVAAAFYNFAPRMVARALPGAWAILAPEDVLALRLEVVDRALRRVLGEPSRAARSPAAPSTRPTTPGRGRRTPTSWCGGRARCCASTAATGTAWRSRLPRSTAPPATC